VSVCVCVSVCLVCVCVRVCVSVVRVRVCVCMCVLRLPWEGHSISRVGPKVIQAMRLRRITRGVKPGLNEKPNVLATW